MLKWILLEADMWVEPPLVEQIFIIESARWLLLHCGNHDCDDFRFGHRQEQEWAVESVPTLVLVIIFITVTI